MNTPIKHLLVSFLTCLVLAGCSGKEQQVLWGIYQEPIEPKPYPTDSGVTELNRLWKADLGQTDSEGYALLRPAYDGKFIFAADRRGKVSKISAEDGTIVWTEDLNTSVFSGVGVGDGLAVVSTDQGALIALSAEKGDLVWTTSVKRQISAVPVVGNTRVVARTADGMIVGLDSKSGRSVWRLEKPVPGLSVHGDSMPTIIGNAVIVGLPSGVLVAANVINGREYWEAEIAYVQGANELERLIDSDTPALVQGNIIYTAAYGSNISALRIEGAERVWKTRLSTRLPMAINETHLFATTLFGGVVAIDIESGDILWEQKGFEGRGVSQPILFSNRIIVGDSNGKLHSLDVQTGNLVQSRNAIGGAILSIAVGDKQFSIYSSEGELAAYSL
ncbi:MAG: outer membrane protein assembly factor BamB [Gammaproteobacteria bacterium]|nr:outer membrane protein assembly factor BamB [Gammaproteobacteria bacterium]